MRRRGSAGVEETERHPAKKVKRLRGSGDALRERRRDWLRIDPRPGRVGSRGRTRREVVLWY